MIRKIMTRQISEEAHERYAREIWGARREIGEWPLTREERIRYEFEDDRSGEER